MRIWLVGLVALIATGCVTSNTIECADGTVCPADGACAPEGGCVRAVQIEACKDASDGTPCAFLDTAGVCINGVCRSFTCGNGTVDDGETCDDGNRQSGDGCRGDCNKLEVCGDLIIDQGEECDDGNTSAGDGCSATCRREFCGNSVVDVGELCDDGNTSAGDGCAANCASNEMCANGVLDIPVGEGCDDGNTLDGDGCEHDCRLPTCGNQILDPGEVCDDGNTTPGDGCNAACSSDESCGNGIIDVAKAVPEQCDDGSNNGPEPDRPCRNDCTRQRCGDNIIDPLANEICDGTSLAGHTCLDFGFYYADSLTCDRCQYQTATCTGFCGDGIANGPELCDGSPSGAGRCLDYGYDMGRMECNSCGVGLAECDVLGWRKDPTMSAQGLFGVGGRGPGDVYAVGQSSSIFHYDGTAWTATDVGANPPLYDIWVGTPAGAVAVGQSEAFHWTGAAWQKKVMPTQALGVWGASPSDVYAAGNCSVMHYDGNAWSTVTVPAGCWIDVWGNAANNVFVISGDGALHYNGATWTPMTLPVASPALERVWGTGPTDVYAASSSDPGVLLHYDGNASNLWAQVTTPGKYLTALGGSGAGDVFAASVDTVYHNDGAGWTTTSLPKNAFKSIWGSAADDLWGVGAFGAWHYNGIGFSNGAQGTGAVVNSVSGTDITHVAIASNLDVSLYDGTKTTNAGLSGGTWLGVYAIGPQDIVTVGIGGDARHLTGAIWNVVTSGTTNHLRSVWYAITSDIFAVGDGGTIVRGTATTWTLQTSNTTSRLWSIWGASSSEVFAVGDAGTIDHFNGAQWTATTPTTVELRGIWGTSATNVYAVGDAGTILHFDGTTWRPMTSGTAAKLLAIHGSSTTDIFASGTGGVLVHFDGSNWAPLRSSTTSDLRGVWVAPDRSRDLILLRSPTYYMRMMRPKLSTELHCDDRWDDDRDDLLDCADPDCATDAACVAGGVCKTLVPIACGQTISTTNLTGIARLDDYRCGTRSDVGPERAFQLAPPAGMNVTVKVTSPTADVDLVVLGAFSSGGCNPSACIGASQTDLLADEQVSFIASGATYVPVVDGRARGGAFTISVTCQ